ncbi:MULTISPECIES: TrmB family transcriptional regulator [Haloferacaceae]|uniref:TrmB family transcriptional regulator n=1 Tax=Halorubrum glutamatedens TaxID=2707018 RepID=A0ABD5QR78_9EURY|nr:TrmB family transcriptional regulator [Halobellus captivus]
MPIGIDEFDSHDPDERETNAERVIGFLIHNRDKAYKAVEIAEATGINENSIHPVLKRLADRDLVRHREPYWAIGDLDAVRNAMTFASTAGFLDEELGPESREEWLAAARNETGRDE